MTNRPPPISLAARPGIGVSPFWLFAGAALVLLILLFSRSMMRQFDMDEHQFVAPAVFFTQKGLAPYRDYPYFHMPSLIYLHGAASAPIAYKLLAARTVSVLCGWATVLLLFWAGWTALEALAYRTRSLLLGGILAAYVCSQLFTYTSGWAWNHDSATLCALAGCLMQLRGMRNGRIGWIALAGALAGLAMGIRLSFALIVVPMGLLVWLGQSPLTWKRRAAAFALAMAGALLVLLPALVPWAEHPAAFVFGNITYAGLSGRFYANMNEGYSTLPGKAYFLLRTFFSDPGNAFLLATGIYGLGYVSWRRRAWRSCYANEFGLLLGLMPALLIGAWGPSPAQQQYFYMLLPFLTLAGIYAAALERAEPAGLARWRNVVIWAALLPALIGLPRWYWKAVYFADVEEWTPVRVHRLGEWIKRNCPPHARVMTADPLFPLEADMDAYPEYAVGRFVFHVGELMQPRDRRQFHMAFAEELDRVLAERPPDAIFRHTKAPTEALTAYAKTHHFRKLEYELRYRDFDAEVECFELWVREPSAQPGE